MPSNILYADSPVNLSHPLVPDAWWLALPQPHNRTGVGSSAWLNLCTHRGLTTHGALTGGPTWGGPQEKCAAIKLVTASSQYVNIGNFYNATQSFTASAWAWRATTGVRHEIISKESGTNGWELSILDTDNAEFGVFTGGFPVVSSAQTLSAGRWYHLVGVRESNAGNLIIYVNGIADGSATTTGVSPATDTGALCIGAQGGGGARYFGGFLNDVCIWQSRALTPVEVRALYEDGLVGHPEMLNWIGRKSYFVPSAAPAGRTTFNTRSHPLGIRAGMGFRIAGQEPRN